MQQSEKKLNDLEQTVNKTAASTERASKKYVASAQEQQRHQQRIIELEKNYQATQAKRAQSAALNAERRANSEVIHQFQKVEQGARGGAAGVGRLNESMASLASRAAGVNPVMGRMAHVLGSMAMGSGLMVGVLGGAAALGYAWNKLTEDGKKLREETERIIARTDALMERQRGSELANISRQIVEEEALKAAAIKKLDDDDLVRSRAIPIGLPTPGITGRHERLAEIEEISRRLAALYAEENRLKSDAIRKNQDEFDRAQKEREKIAGQVPEFDKIMRGLKEQELGFAQSARAAFEYALSLNEKLTPAQRELALAQYDATQAAEADRRERDDAAKATDANAKAVQDTIRRLQEQNIELRLGEDALLRHTLAQQNATDEQIRAALAYARDNREREKARKDAEKAADDARQQEKERDREIKSHANQIAGAAGDAFGSWVSGAQSAEVAFRRMTESILSDLARLTMQKAFTDPLSSILAGFIGGAFPGGGGSTPAGTVDAGGSGFALRMPPPSTGTAGSAIVLHQSVNFSVSAMDSRGVSEMLREQKGTIAGVVAEAVRESSAFRNQLRS